MRILLIKIAALILFLFGISETNAQINLSQTFLNRLEGNWSTDKGKSFGMPAVVTMVCKKSLDSKFIELSYTIEMSAADGKKHVFEGRAFYKPVSEIQFVGTWFDSGGETHPIKASHDSTTLTSLWGTAETKLGKTLYVFSSPNIIEIIDFIMKKDSSWKEFNRNTLYREHR
ncbi:DUF1579 domain-containing protein [bacterium]|nr:MAG: DUF1579 domain-containing protein [bacterium]